MTPSHSKDLKQNLPMPVSSLLDTHPGVGYGPNGPGAPPANKQCLQESPGDRGPAPSAADGDEQGPVATEQSLQKGKLPAKGPFSSWRPLSGGRANAVACGLLALNRIFQLHPGDAT